MARQLRTVTVDLTPLLPGGDNGGAKALAKAVVSRLGQLAPEIDFTLLTSAAGYAEVADLESTNVHRVCVEALPELSSDRTGFALRGARAAVRVAIDRLLPPTTGTQVKDRVWMLLKRAGRARATRTIRSDLVFCPFTAPYFFDPRVPLVSVVHDLQYLQYPGFFTERQRLDRHRNFLDACRCSDSMICVSEFVRATVLATGEIPPERAQTIRSALLRDAEPDPRSARVARQLLKDRGVRPSRFLLYPANAWPHKNHRRLVEAFAIYTQRQREPDLALVCTGAPSSAMSDVNAVAETLLPPGTFAFMGYLSDDEFAALLQTCRALIFPSLYEGFGLPVLEGMAYERPVLCSNVTSLPEIAGDAALLFDPRDPLAIAEAIVRLESDDGLEACLVRRGRERVAHFGTALEMAAQYLAVFKRTVDSFKPRAPSGAATERRS